jgi:parallel beta-helix repeat protein
VLLMGGVLGATFTQIAGQVGVAAATYYVAPNGSPSNSGTSQASPWTMERALQAAPDGSTVLFLNGTYRLSTKLYLNHRLTLQANTGATVWIKGSVVIPDGEWVVNGDDWVRNNWTVAFPQPANQDPKEIDPAYPRANYGDMVFVNDASLIQVSSRNAVVPGTFYVDYAADKLYIGTDPMGKLVEATVKSNSFDVSVAGTIVRGLRFAHFADSGLQIGAPNVTIENNMFTWNGQAGLIAVGTFGSYASDASRNLVVRGNTFTYNGENGLLVIQSSHALIENNTVNHNNAEHFQEQYSAAGIKIAGSDYTIIRNNQVTDNFATGIWMDIGSDHVTAVGNQVRNNHFSGIWYEISSYADIVGNVLVNNPIGVNILTASNARVYNNTMVGGSISLSVGHQNRSVRPGSTSQTAQNIIVNNIFASASGSTDTGSMVDTWTPNYAACPNTTPMISWMDANFYFRANPAAPKLIRWVDPPLCYAEISALQDLQMGAPVEMHGLEGNASTAMFVDAAGGNYQLVGGSPALGAGLPPPADIAALLGVTAGQCVDMGAVQTHSGVCHISLASFLYAPPNGQPQRNYSVSTNVELSWGQVSYAAGYELQVDDSPMFDAPLVYENNTLSANTLSASMTMPYDNVFYWRVRAKDETGVWRPWTATERFIVNTP